ncbi:hypothetical protein [Azospirillum griseum]|uniref:Uncharacterized protein n=1 Tax=Azospirillum griseum TaxID=2496639 RepID=A0A3S0HX20_9PROT|nr:hypothetical protein [Azospirillum griseum]RTR15525.1 hypothetical protein EJ903_22990 [Azospirillum griseum]
MPEAVKISVLEEAAKRLTELDPKVPEAIPIREAVQRLQPQIKASLDKGYSYDDILTLLSKIDAAFGSVAASTLRKYLAPPREKSASGRARTAQRRTGPERDRSVSACKQRPSPPPHPSGVPPEASAPRLPVATPAPSPVRNASQPASDNAAFREDM